MPYNILETKDLIYHWNMWQKYGNQWELFLEYYGLEGADEETFKEIYIGDLDELSEEEELDLYRHILGAISNEWLQLINLYEIRLDVFGENLHHDSLLFLDDSSEVTTLARQWFALNKP